jgi:glycosyltransferase involved in cell wall biosynthesis
MSTPRISVLLPCFNHGAYLDEAIGSVLAQTFQDFEIVLVDDGSTDPQTVEKIQHCSAPRTRVFRIENGGLSGARNFAAAQAHGALFCALDADDRLAPTWFEKAVARLDADPDLAFVSHWLRAFGDESWEWTPQRCELTDLLVNNMVNGAALVRREVFEAVGGFEVSMRDGCEDWDFWLRVVEQGYRGTIIPEFLFEYRRRADSMSRLMSAGAGYPLPLHQVISRHQAYYRDHIVEVTARKDDDIADLRREVIRLRTERMMSLEPRLARAREELTAELAKIERVRPIVEARQTLQHLSAELEGLQSERRDLLARLEEQRSEAERQRTEAEQQRVKAEQQRAVMANDLAQLDARLTEAVSARDRLSARLSDLNGHVTHLDGEIAALRRSWSWRITEPLRRVHSALNRSKS